MSKDDHAVTVPFTTLLKIALTVLLAFILMKIWPVILMVIIAILLAVMLDPIAVGLEQRKISQQLTAKVPIAAPLLRQQFSQQQTKKILDKGLVAGKFVIER